MVQTILLYTHISLIRGLKFIISGIELDCILGIRIFMLTFHSEIW